MPDARAARRRDGWVYVMRHVLWDRIGETGAVKIGHTRTDPAKRGLRISSASGLLRPPTVAFCCWVADRAAVERAVHQQLGRYRVHRRREMFRVSVETARSVIEASTEVRALRLPNRSTGRRSTGRRSTGRRLWRLGGRMQRWLIGLAMVVVSGWLLWLRWHAL